MTNSENEHFEHFEQIDNTENTEINSAESTEIVKDTVISKHISKGRHESKSNKSDSSQSRWFDFIDWLEILSVALIMVILVFTFIFRVATIEGQSMEPTFYEREKVIISNLNYSPKDGDVVIISRNYKNDCTVSSSSHEEKPIIKRVIATAGQTVKIDFSEGVVFVDDQRLNEPYTATPTNRYFTDEDVERFAKGVTVPEGCIFVLGDNRNNSLDSRSSTIGDRGDGMVNENFIIGKVLFRIFPINKFGGIK